MPIVSTVDMSEPDAITDNGNGIEVEKIYLNQFRQQTIYWKLTLSGSYLAR